MCTTNFQTQWLEQSTIDFGEKVGISTLHLYSYYYAQAVIGPVFRCAWEMLPIGFSATLI